MLLSSTSFVISVLFGDVETSKIGSFCVSSREIIGMFSEHNNFPRFLPIGGRYSQFIILPLFHKMLKSL